MNIDLRGNKDRNEIKLRKTCQLQLFSQSQKRILTSDWSEALEVIEKICNFEAELWHWKEIFKVNLLIIFFPLNQQNVYKNWLNLTQKSQDS